MFGSSILEVAIGLVLVYLLLSLICSAIQESMEARLKIRASNLEQGLRELLKDSDGKDLLQHLYNHPMIFGLFCGEYDPDNVRSSFIKTLKDLFSAKSQSSFITKLKSFFITNWESLFSTNLPTHIPAANFAVALIDTLVRGSVKGKPVKGDPAQGCQVKKDPPLSGEISIDSLRTAVVNHVSVDNNVKINDSVQRALLLSLDAAQGDLAKAQANIEAWFNSCMERVSGRYKRRMQIILLGLGVVVAVSLNVDSMKVATELYHNDAMRAAAVAEAGAISKSDKLDVKSPLASLDKLNLPIGWKGGGGHWFTEFKKAVPSSFVGWLLTAFAISFGAPFWFDLLNKLMSIRSTMKPQDKGPANNSETPQSRENKAVSLRGATESVTISPASATLLAAMDYSTFQSHEWATGDDPQGGVL